MRSYPRIPPIPPYPPAPKAYGITFKRVSPRGEAKLFEVCERAAKVGTLRAMHGTARGFELTWWELALGAAVFTFDDLAVAKRAVGPMLVVMRSRAERARVEESVNHGRSTAHFQRGA